MSFAETQDTEIEGSLVYIVHAEWNSTDLVYDRTVLALTTQDDLNVSVDEDDEDLNLSSQRRTERYRTHNTIDLEVSSALDVDMAVAERIGVTDVDGNLVFDKDNREITTASPEEHIEVAYADHELDPSVGLADAEMVHRFSDLELTSPEIDPSETPTILSWTWWVNGDVVLNYDVTAE